MDLTEDEYKEALFQKDLTEIQLKNYEFMKKNFEEEIKLRLPQRQLEMNLEKKKAEIEMNLKTLKANLKVYTSQVREKKKEVPMTQEEIDAE